MNKGVWIIKMKLYTVKLEILKYRFLIKSQFVIAVINKHKNRNPQCEQLLAQLLSRETY